MMMSFIAINIIITITDDEYSTFLNSNEHFQNAYWKEALKILKLVVTRSSSLQVVPQGSPGGTSHHYYGSFSDSELFCKKVCHVN